MDHQRTPGVWVQYPYCISLCVISFRRYSAPVLVRHGQSRIFKGLPYLCLSLFFGWWGFPFGLIFTPICLAQTLAGGTELGPALPAPPMPSTPSADPVFGAGSQRMTTSSPAACPSCGSGSRMTRAAGRVSCGVCGYEG